MSWPKLIPQQAQTSIAKTQGRRLGSTVDVMGSDAKTPGQAGPAPMPQTRALTLAQIDIIALGRADIQLAWAADPLVLFGNHLFPL